MLVYHRTVAADAILEEGFRDASGSYMTSNLTLTGIWVGDTIHEIYDGVLGDDVFEIQIDAALLDPFEAKDLSGEQFFREWCVPASILNEHAHLRRLTPDEEDEVR